MTLSQMRLSFVDSAASGRDRAAVMRLIRRVRPGAELVPTSRDEADLVISTPGARNRSSDADGNRPHLIFGDGSAEPPMAAPARMQRLDHFLPLALFADIAEAPSRSLASVAFIADGEQDTLDPTVAAAIRDRVKLGLFATTAPGAQALESVSGCRVQTLSATDPDEELRPFDAVASFSHDQIIGAAAMLKPAIWLHRGSDPAAGPVPPTTMRGLPTELPAILAICEPDRLLPDLFNWKRSAERDAAMRVDRALAVMGL